MSPATHALPVLTDAELTLRPSRPDDAPTILELLHHPDVAEWWGLDNTLTSVEEELEGAFTIEVDGSVVGILECHEETEPMYPSVAFDIALATHLHGRQLGRRALRLAVEHFISLGHHRFTIDPAVTNQVAIRCYQHVGFRPVGILRSCERAPDGTWRDALLMDLLSWELDEHPLPL
jgi:aminoglycoside 6'-N-acetyltransferase